MTWTWTWTWSRAPLRLVDEPGHADAALTTALRDWGADAHDSRAIARLEQQLAAALAQPRAATRRHSEPFVPPVPMCLLGLWVVNAAIALLLSSQAPPRELMDTRATDSQPAALSAVEFASRLGVGPSELAAHEAMNPLHVAPWR